MRKWPLLLFSLTISARAMAEASDTAVAEALFQAGRECLERGRIEEACAKFSESQRLEPKLGTLLNLATCHEKLGKTASAWAEFTQAKSLARAPQRSDHRAFAERHLRHLSDHLSTVSIRWEEPASGESVELDGVSVGVAAMNTELPVDPGEHIVRASAPGRVDFEQHLDVEVGPARQSVLIPELAREPSVRSETATTKGTEPEPAAPVAPATPQVAPRATSSVRHEPKSAATPPAAVALLITGGLAVAVGSFAGLRAFSLKSAAQKECNGEPCSQRGLDLYSEVHTAANISTVAFGVALAALGSGTFLLLRAPTGTRGTAGISVGGAL